MVADAIILFAHGARDPLWAGPVEAVAHRLRAHFPDRVIKVAFLEFMSPTLPEAVAQVLDENISSSSPSIHILPFFIAQGGHLRKELPEMLDSLRECYQGQQFVLHPPLGELPEVQTAMASAIADLLS